MSTVIASNIPKTVSLDKVKEFFGFSGKVDSVDVKSSDTSTNTYAVTFASSDAVSSALLLNGAELDGKPIQITDENSNVASQEPILTSEKVVQSGISPDSSSAAAVANVPFTDAGVAANAKTTSAGAKGDAPNSDIDQELKPKSAIIAEYLSHGYVLSDQALEKAVALDKKHGVSEKFKSFLSNLDSKYHVQDKAVETDQKYDLNKRFAQGRDDLTSYFEQAAKTPAGSKIHSFYSGIVRDSKQIHQEARRLANLKSGSGASNAGATTSATDNKQQF